MTATAANPHVFDATAERFQQDVLQKSLETPVLIDFWAEWCQPCKTLGPILEKLAGEYNGAFVLAKVDVEAEQQLGAAFQIRSIPTVYLMKDGQLVDGFAEALPEGVVREFLKSHGIEPGAAAPADVEAEAPPVDPHAEVVRLRRESAEQPDKPELQLDLALALLATGAQAESEQLLDALPANLATDDRSVRARAKLGFLKVVADAPPAATLEAALVATPEDSQARYLLGARLIAAGQDQAGLEQLIELLRRDRAFQEGLPRKALIDAFRVVADEDLVGVYRRKMSALLF
ncbi:tetratricopeptide repeat protein [Lysobacter sp. K5869]|uniref:tetratricopeptide repeat protein n=1 Tax=Lysobacter sp. K5869 TaxID=2820808 RepID=UPI001C05F9FB|nr:tetratricopeptide repeat protein [Lysobacter sp. K5869]QWP79171.1 tetratricopeptide repeat protein [Lysobacter sp. K5869]